MKRYIIPAIISTAVLLLFVSANLAHGQVVYGNRTYTAPVCNRSNCTMCNAIRSGLQAQRQSSYAYQWSYQWQTQPATVSTSRVVTTTSAAQTASKPEDVGKMLALLDLTPSDMLADIGCGDGRVVIAAVERYGCRAVGIEIDPKKAAEARRNVLKAVSDHRIPDGSVTIITGDAAQRTPDDVSAAVVYLFPETLEELRPVLQRIPRVVSSQHPIPGMTATVERDGLYLYRNERPAPVVTRPPVPTVRRVGSIQIVE